MTPETFLLLNLAAAFYNVGAIWTRESERVQARKVSYRVFIPVAAAPLGSLSAMLYHPAEWPIWPAWFGVACQVTALGVAVVFWRRGRANPSEDEPSLENPPLGMRRSPHWIRAVLITSYAIVLLGWIVVGKAAQADSLPSGPLLESGVVAPNARAMDNGGSAAAKTFQLAGRVTGGDGKHVIYISLWQANDFMTRPSQVVRIDPGTQAVFRFGVGAGKWATSAYEDSNGNGELDMGRFGPKEPAGFWREFTAWHKPKFDEVASLVEGDIDNANIQLR